MKTQAVSSRRSRAVTSSFVHVAVFILSSFWFHNCSDNTGEQTNQVTLAIDSSVSDSLIPPVSVVAANPVVVNLDTCKEPQIIDVPTEVTGKTITLKSGKIVPLVPPLVNPAGFLSVMKNYTTDDGLALDHISCALMDHMGNLWYGTHGGGVSRYDGKSFVNYTTEQGLAENIVLGMLEDTKGNMWFTTSTGGVSKFDGHSFVTFTQEQGLARNSVWCVAEDKSGNIWFGTDGGGISKFDGKSFFNFSIAQGLPDSSVRSMITDKRGDLWIGTEDHGLSHFDGKTFSNISENLGRSENDIWCLTEDKSGNIWFGTNGHGVARYDGDKIVDFTKADGLSDNIVFSILEDKAGDLWFGTARGGLSHFNLATRTNSDSASFTNFTTGNGLPNNDIRSITQDQTGNIWIGTYGGGVACHRGPAFTNFTIAQGLAHNTVVGIAEDKENNLWFCTYGGGVSHYDGSLFTNLTINQGLAGNTVWCATEDTAGNIWIGTNGAGVSRYDGKTFTTYTKAHGLGDNKVISCLTDDEGFLWFGTWGGGVSRFDGSSFTTYTTENGLVGTTIKDIVQDSKGNIWFAAYDGGVSRYDGTSFTNYTSKQGLPNEQAWSIAEDQAGNIWIGTAAGISRFDGSTFITYNISNGLPDNNVTQVIVTTEKGLNSAAIVMGTNFGLGVLLYFTPKPGTDITGIIPADNNLSSQELEKYMPVFENYNSATGSPVKDVNAGCNAMFVDHTGAVWIGTGADKTGLVRFDISAVHRNSIPNTVTIQNIKVNEENISWYELQSASGGNNLPVQNGFPSNITEQITTFGRVLNSPERDTMLQKFGDIEFDSITGFYPLPQKLELPYSDNNVTFDFAAIEPSSPSLVQYQYMLVGYDDNWSPLTTNTSATFGNIYEGKYVFKVKARSPFGLWSEPIEYSFAVRPPWWRTYWMYSIYLIALVGLVYSIVRWNGKRLRAKAKELTDEVRKATQTIVEQKKVVEEKNKDITDSINYALRIQQAFLPDKKEILESFPSSFILFKPKDIVSGDFYFFQKNNESLLLASADCTGHGVPGAFMSMVGSERLTDATQQSTDVGEILSILNKGVKISLKQSGSDSATRDGMDIAFCSINQREGTLHYAGANRPLWIIRKDSGAIEEIKATKTAIGGFTKDDQAFESHQLQLAPGDSFYIFTDGYADTFGGKNGKKLTTKRFRELLLTMQHMSMPEQESHLDQYIEDWKDGTEQIDDILVIGIRL